MILVDMSQISLASMMMHLNMNKTTKPDESMVRHMILNSLRMYRTRFKQEYGELILCFDSRHYWRRDHFPNYKAGRKKSREDSNLDWDAIFSCLNDIKQELKDYFPYKHLEVYGAEADDIIATLVKHDQGDPDTIIISSDKDFIQLHGFHVKQYSPVSKKFVNGTPPQEYLREHIIKGDRSDGVPNVLSPDDTFTESKRQKPIRKTMLITLTEAMERWEPKDLFQLAKCSRDTWVRNWQRNETLIDLNKIPDDIRDKILREYKNAQTGDRSKLFNYFVEKKLNNLIQSIGDF